MTKTFDKKMKRMLVGDCPQCGGRIEFPLSRFLDRPMGLPQECSNCATLLSVSPNQPVTAKSLNVIAYLAIVPFYWYADRTPLQSVLGIFGLLLIYYLVSRTFGRPKLVVYTPDRDFLKEELSCDETFPDSRLITTEQDKSNKTQMATPRKPCD